MSAIECKADIALSRLDVPFLPKADINECWRPNRTWSNLAGCPTKIGKIVTKVTSFGFLHR
jgi:hypothetical protein